MPYEGEKTVVQIGNPSFEVEILGPKDAESALFLVHGFGVKRDSRGLFTDIQTLFSDKMLTVVGDFSQILEGATRALPITTQANRLNEIVDYTVNNYPIMQAAYVGHSQGGLVVAKALPENGRIILLAPPIESPAERFAQTAGWKRPNSILNTEDESLLARSDGTFTQVGSDYWSDFQQLDAPKLYENLRSLNRVRMIFAGDDKVLSHQEAPIWIPSEEIPFADHDFSGISRIQVLQRLGQYLSI